uniref:Uncharacterized protein n=1 Tax=Mycena chlorophos TaxID=658473 RepID=A0ABQ0LIS5_MYCCL|nr:predicted protein [Mycena chlorophos]
MDDIRRLWRFKFEVLGPLERDILVELADPPEGPDESLSMSDDPEATLVWWVIYAELFHHSLEVAYLPLDVLASRPAPLSSILRYKWIVYCMPDADSFHSMDFANDELPDFYKSRLQHGSDGEDLNPQLSMYIELAGLLRQSLWLKRLDPTPMYNNLHPAHRRIFIESAMSLGFRSLELLLPEGPQLLAPDLEKLARDIADALPVVSAGPVDVGGRPGVAELRELFDDPWLSSTAPSLQDDLKFTLWGNWKGPGERSALTRAVRSRLQRDS